MFALLDLLDAELASDLVAEPRPFEQINKEVVVDDGGADVAIFEKLTSARLKKFDQLVQRLGESRVTKTVSLVCLVELLHAGHVFAARRFIEQQGRFEIVVIAVAIVSNFALPSFPEALAGKLEVTIVMATKDDDGFEDFGFICR